MIPVCEEELLQFEIQEAGYGHVLVDLDHISTIPGLPHPDMFEKNEDFKEEMQEDITHVDLCATEAYFSYEAFPIAQSYADIILRGC